MNTQFNREKHEKNLPDSYCKTASSNNTKILSIEKRSVDILRDSIEVLYKCLDIDTATGNTLDLYGEMIGQFRGVSTDEQLRVLIKNRIARNFADADFNSVIRAISSTFGCKPADIILTELDEPCNVMLEGLPIHQINKSGIDMNTAVQIINGLLPAGVYMAAMNLAGTFEFSDTELVYDEVAGFADEAQTIGGYLGLVSDNSGSNLPV